MKPTRAAFLAAALKHQGLPYIWGGRSIHGVDCFGFVALTLFESSQRTVDLREGWWTDRAWGELNGITTPLPGDLCFYGGKSEEDVSHVMIVLHPPCPGLPNGFVFGASGGGRGTTSFLAAMAAGAAVLPKTSIRYRKPDDFRGFRSMAPYLTEE